MSRNFLLVFALAALAAVVWLLSTKALDPKRLMVGEFGQERPFKSKPARELIANDDLAAYEKALATSDCTTAHRLLNGAFIRAHPEFRRAKWQPECGLNDDCRQWARYAHASFDELGHCEDVRDLDKLQAALRQKQATVPKFTGRTWSTLKPPENELVRRRDEVIAALLLKAKRDVIPAIEYAADLVQRGDIFDADAEAEYYLRNRACHLANTCTNTPSRRDALRASLPADRAALIEWKAKADVRRPDLQALLMGTRIEGAVVSSSPEPEGLNPKRLLFGEDGSPYKFSSKPAQALMSGEEYAAYQEHLEALDVDAAGKILNEAFLRAYPKFERARLKPDCTEHPDCRFWLLFAGTTFPEYGFAWTSARLSEAERELGKRNSPVPKFAMKPIPADDEPYPDTWLWRRDNSLATMISIAGSDFAPALRKLAELVRRGDVFKAANDAEFYLLLRMCYFGDVCEEAASRGAELRPVIPPERVAVIEKAAARAVGPNLNSLLLGETSF